MRSIALSLFGLILVAPVAAQHDYVGFRKRLLGSVRVIRLKELSSPSRIGGEASMRLTIDNFRAIEHQEIDLAPITVVYGANGAGKSSLLYALLTLKNVILSSNAAVSGFFNYGFASLGGFDAVVFDHLANREIGLSLAVQKAESTVEHSISFSEGKGIFRISLKGDVSLGAELPVTFPYPANLAVSFAYHGATGPDDAVFSWNGIAAQVLKPAQASPGDLQRASAHVVAMNGPAEVLRRAGIVPLKRGFSKPYYQSQPLSPLLITEDEVATHLSLDKYLISRVSFYLEKILDRDFRVNVQPGTAIFSLDATDRRTGVATELVNDGFGVNQMVFFLAKALSRDAELTCVEEPEIHLHPSAVRAFGRALAEMINIEKKAFLVSTHSEAFVTSLLALVAEGRLSAADVAFYFVRKEGKKAVFERQSVHADGQIEGGLGSFMEGELQDLRSFLKVASP